MSTRRRRPCKLSRNAGNEGMALAGPAPWARMMRTSRRCPCRGALIAEVWTPESSGTDTVAPDSTCARDMRVLSPSRGRTPWLVRLQPIEMLAVTSRIGADITLRPMRDTERTSTRARPQGVNLTTTSSSNPNQRVVSVASMRPLLLSAVTICHPASPPPGRDRSLIKRYRQRNGSQVWISLALERGDFGSPLQVIRRVCAKRHDRVKRRRILQVCADVVDRRHSSRSALEFERHPHRNQTRKKRRRSDDHLDPRMTPVCARPAAIAPSNAAPTPA